MGLRDHGYVEGKNINLVFRWAETAELLPGLAAELVRLNVDVLVAPSSTEVEAVRSATTVIPIHDACRPSWSRPRRESCAARR